MIKVIYTTRDSWAKSDMYAVNDVVFDGERLANVFSLRDQAVHAQQAKPIRGLWALGKLLEMEACVDQVIQMFVDKLGHDFADTEPGKRYFAWDAAANVTFGHPLGFIQQGRDVRRLIKESRDTTTYFAVVSQIPWLDSWLGKNPIVPLGSRGILWSFSTAAELYAEYDSAASGNAKAGDDCHGNYFIDKYHKLKDTHPDCVDDKQVMHYLVLNVAAGGDPVAGALRAIVYHLAKSSPAYRKLVAELDAAQFSLPAQWKDVSKLLYLDAVIYEAARMAPSIGSMLERIVPAKGLELPDGRYIPAGTKVGINPCVISRDTHVFGDDVDSFKPERWLQRPDEDDQQYAMRYQRMRETADFMFGTGSRVCMGKALAKMEMYKLTATLYRMFDASVSNRHWIAINSATDSLWPKQIRLPDERHEWTYRNSWFMFHENIPMVITRRT
ncbi:cytochrome P450 [Purpureocillium lilacinum]|uniref:Cytochrome P450 n=1 Tax=Purpureocillium lilacinum TaxID=33203 RepID=A0A179HAY8_PURLI|nr:cytochrome P450 [Purpureocillium lilacinum]OAQ87455.1 cytochrome P450 [Purpureocillium lilacinum]OAQ95414.1 cytochrome P450 [Purpureocillium lilacinum]